MLLHVGQHVRWSQPHVQADCRGRQVHFLHFLEEKIKKKKKKKLTGLEWEWRDTESWWNEFVWLNLSQDIKSTRQRCITGRVVGFFTAHSELYMCSENKWICFCGRFDCSVILSRGTEEPCEQISWVVLTQRVCVTLWFLLTWLLSFLMLHFCNCR